MWDDGWHHAHRPANHLLVTVSKTDFSVAMSGASQSITPEYCGLAPSTVSVDSMESLFRRLRYQEAEPDATRGVTSGKIVHCICVGRNGHIWFGTNGGAYRYDGDTLANISDKDGLSNNAVHSIVEDKAGNLWFGTTHGGICRFDGESFTNFTEKGIVDGKEIWCIHEDNSGNIWFSGKRFGTYRFDGSSFKKFDQKDGLRSPGLMCILEDNKNRLWLGGVNGLFRFNGHSFSKITKDGPWN